MTTAPRHAVLLSATSASVLGYEILLMRLLSIGQWHHFAYMAISMALLGFGVAGSLLFLFFREIERRPDGWLVGLAGATAVSFSLAFSLSQKVGLDPLQLLWQPAEWAALFLTYLLMSVPFLLAGGIIGIILTGAGERTHRMYAVDLLSAGCGALAIVPALYLGLPWTLLPALGALVLLGSLFCCIKMKKPWVGATTLLTSAVLLILSYELTPPVPKIHDTKSLPMTLSFPDARVETTSVGPLGVIHVVGSDLIRQFPGLSLNFGLGEGGQEETLPKQKAVFTDGDALSPITRFRGEIDRLRYLDFTSMALPYHIRKPEKVLVVGAGGGSDVLLGLRHRAGSILALEANKQIADLLLKSHKDFSGDLYSRPGVRLEVREARQFLRSTRSRFDLIVLSLIDSFATSAGGLHSATESYLYTTEAFILYLSRLSESGMLAVTRWLKLPPRDSLRVVATALAAIRQLDLSPRPEEHILFIRSWNTSTIIVSKSPLTPRDIARATTFCDDRSFDLAYYAGMERGRANRYDVLKSPYYFEGAKALSGPEAGSFLRNYVFDVSATTDDRPFFSHFFRWDKALTLFKHLRREWLPMIELGYVFVLATLIQAVLASGALILFPLFFLRRIQGVSSKKQGAEPRFREVMGILLYFGCIGVGFMFFEMALLPRYTLLLSHPVYSAAVVLSTLLVFAGFGSMSVGRIQAMGHRFLWIPVAALVIWVGFHIISGDRWFQLAMGWSFGGRLALAVLLLSLISFFLGWPFPSGLRVVSDRFPALVPWAWGVNGCASVIGVVLGKALMVSIGFRMMMIVSCVLYLLAVITFQMTFRGRGTKRAE